MPSPLHSNAIKAMSDSARKSIWSHTCTSCASVLVASTQQLSHARLSAPDSVTYILLVHTCVWFSSLAMQFKLVSVELDLIRVASHAYESVHVTEHTLCALIDA